jgi:hypothetical protein
MTWLTIVVSLGCSVVVAYLTPQFSHFAWRKQKRREQQLEIAERFAQSNSNLWLASNTPSAGLVDMDNARIAQNALVLLIVMLFDDEDTLSLIAELRKKIASDDEEGDVVLRMRIAPRLFAEALGIHMEPLKSTNKAK